MLPADAIARVDEDRAAHEQCGVDSLQTAARQCCDLVRAHRDHDDAPSCASIACRRTTRSSKGTTTPADSCPCSCPLPATTSTSPGRARLTAASMARARSGSTSTREPAGISRCIASRISAGSSDRGLSLVKIARSAPQRRGLPHQRSLVAVAISPAAQHDKHSRAAIRQRSRVSQHGGHRTGRVRVVDEGDVTADPRRRAQVGPARCEAKRPPRERPTRRFRPRRARDRQVRRSRG